MKYLTLSTFLFFCIGFSQTASKGTFILVAETKVDADQWFGKDAFGYAYFSKGNVFYKQKEQEVWEYKNLILGKITKVDIINPLRILLYYEPFNTIVTLDNQLNEILKTDFNLHPSIVTSAIGLASRDRYWYFNTQSQKLGLLEYFQHKFTEFPRWITNPMVLYDSTFNEFYWINETGEWWTCDIFGKMQMRKKIKDIVPYCFLDAKTLLAKKDGKFVLVFTTKEEVTPVPELENLEGSFRFQNQILSIFTQTKLVEFQINLP
jgi:hypothetical protein